VRKNGSGYYLVLHPLHPAAGRPDFVPWLLGKQQMSLMDTPPSMKAVHSKPADPAATVALVRPPARLLNAMSLRQMSRDLGAVPGTPGKSRPPQQAVLSALANLGLPTPAVTGARPAAGARQGAVLHQATNGEDVSMVSVAVLVPAIVHPIFPINVDQVVYVK
jgi:hypothetical protein